MNKLAARLKRAKRGRLRIKERLRLSVHRSSRNIYAQIIDDQTGKTLVSVSTLEKALRDQLTGDKTAQATQMGKAMAQRAKEKGIEEVAFDRSGFKYHGRVKAFAQAAREGGLAF
ncbi:MAG: 50S ribosomal protein L18 [Legionellales bacterium]|nr:50S ribosomal protein L18 [Legionellales bacterium]